MLSKDWNTAIRKFKELNEIENNDRCLDEGNEKMRFSDEESRQEILKLIDDLRSLK